MMLGIYGGSGYHNINMHEKNKFPNLQNLVGSTFFDDGDQSLIKINDGESFRNDNLHGIINFSDL